LNTDAEECWTQLANGLKEVPGIDASGNTVTGGRRFVDQFMMAEMRREYVSEFFFLAGHPTEKNWID